MFLSMCSCGSLGTRPATLKDSMQIPEDGIITAEIFEQLKEENGVVTFTGDSNGLHYEWTVFGSDIETPKDCNMSLEFTPSESVGLSLYFNTTEEFGFEPALSVYLNELWDVQGAVVYRRTNGGLDEVCSATVTGSKTSIVNFSAISTVGNFVIMKDTDSVVASELKNENTSSTTVTSDNATTSGNTITSDNTTMSDNTITSDAATTDASYLSSVSESGGRILSDGSQTEQDKYLTDPVPEGKPMPVEPENQTVNNEKTYTCTFSIECSTILNNLADLESEKLDEVPSNGIILPTTTVTFYEGESVYDVLQRVCKENSIQMEASWTPIYNSAYVEGIHNLYEFDCGNLSGWMYRVNGWYPNYGCSRYQLAQGDIVEWRYTCDLGNDVGGGYAVGGE